VTIGLVFTSLVAAMAADEVVDVVVVGLLLRAQSKMPRTSTRQDAMEKRLGNDGCVLWIYVFIRKYGLALSSHIRPPITYLGYRRWR